MSACTYLYLPIEYFYSNIIYPKLSLSSLPLFPMGNPQHTFLEIHTHIEFDGIFLIMPNIYSHKHLHKLKYGLLNIL